MFDTERSGDDDLAMPRPPRKPWTTPRILLGSTRDTRKTNDSGDAVTSSETFGVS